MLKSKASGRFKNDRVKRTYSYGSALLSLFVCASAFLYVWFGVMVFFFACSSNEHEQRNAFVQKRRRNNRQTD